MRVRLLKDLEFARWARKERLTDQMLQHAADEIERGLAYDDSTIDRMVRETLMIEVAR